MASNRSRSRSRSPQRDVKALLADARSCLDSFPRQLEDAYELFERAHALAPDDLSVLDAFGTFLCEEGEAERAERLLRRSVELAPDAGAEKHLYLAQLSEGAEALAHYEHGAKVLQGLQGPEAARQLARAQAAIAELFMTDLCDLPEAEERCEAALAAGLKVNNCPQLLAAKATLRRVQGMLDEARELALGCAARVKAARHAAERREVGEAGEASNQIPLDVEAEPEELADETLVSLSETLIEVGHTQEARELLLFVLDHDEEDPQVWYLLACSHLVDKEISEVQECVEQGLRFCKGVEQGAEWKSRFRQILKDAGALSVPQGEQAPVAAKSSSQD